MSIEQIVSISICSATLIVWLLALYSSVSMRRLGRLVQKARTMPMNDVELPPISVIVLTHDQEYELRRNLPLILEQYYPNYEVIVVDMASKDGTKELLERLEEDHHNLRHTFTPATSRDISLTRLGITLGMKAAANKWVLLTQADCTPVSHSWIRHMANAMSHHRAAQMVLGYTRITDDNNYTKRKLQHFNLWQQMIALPYAEKHGAYRTGGENLLYNRDLFMQHNGFASDATLLTGATDIMVNRNSTKHNTTICTHADAVLNKNVTLEKRMWKQERLFFQETRTHFKRKYLYRMNYALRVIIHALNQLLLVLTIALGVYMALQQPIWYVACGAAFILWLIQFIVQGKCYNFTSTLTDNRKQNFFRTGWFITMTPLWDMKAWLRHKFTSEKQFRKKYI